MSLPTPKTEQTSSNATSADTSAPVSAAGAPKQSKRDKRQRELSDVSMKKSVQAHNAMSVTAFVEKMKDLINKERVEEIAETEDSLSNVPMKTLEQRGVALSKLSVSSRRTGLYGRLVSYGSERALRLTQVRIQVPFLSLVLFPDRFSNLSNIPFNSPSICVSVADPDIHQLENQPWREDSTGCIEDLER